jgi:hypothetical protein
MFQFTYTTGNIFIEENLVKVWRVYAPRYLVWDLEKLGGLWGLAAKK